VAAQVAAYNLGRILKNTLPEKSETPRNSIVSGRFTSWSPVSTLLLLRNSHIMNINELIAGDPDILSGQTVFAGTRVPVETLFDHLEAGIPLNEFLDNFPTVSREQAVGLLLVRTQHDN
jgi:uncharacterized protein (DUF433 family)